MAPRNLVPKNLVHFTPWRDPVAGETLGEAPEVRLISLDLDGPSERFWEAIATAHGFHQPRPPYEGTAELIERSPHLLAMGVGGAGYDTIDADACTEAGILVVNQSGIGSEAVAEHVVGMMLGLSKRIVLADRAMRSGADYHRHDFRGYDLEGQTVGVVGFGNIGSRIGEICRADFRMRVLAHDPYLGDEEVVERGGEPVSLDDLLRQSDFVSINTPLSAGTRGLIGLRELRLMKPTAFFITTARGEVTDERALVQVMSEGGIAGAGVDVWDPEPPSPDNPLLKMDNVIACPHVAGVTVQAHHGAEVAGAHQWIGIFRGERPPRLQNPDVWPRYRERYRKVTGDDLAE